MRTAWLASTLPTTISKVLKPTGAKENHCASYKSIQKPQTGSELRTIKGHTGTVFGLSLIADGQMLVSAGEDKTIKIWGKP